MKLNAQERVNTRLTMLKLRRKPDLKTLNFATILESLEKSMVDYNAALIELDAAKIDKAKL